MHDLKYFSIEEYLKNFQIEQFVLEHLAEVQEKFDKYLKAVLAIGKEEAMNFLTMELYNELLFSNAIEEKKIMPPNVYLKHDLITLGQNLTNKKICNIQSIFLKHTQMPYPVGEYRTVPVFIKREGQVVYNAPDVKDLPEFMTSFIRFFNKNSDDFMHNDPFVKAALIHFIFIKIHPFVDGNGRVSRILHNLKFTDLVNKTYGSNEEELKLKLTPINISYSIYNNKYSYYDRLNAIPFYKGADINDSVNKWIDFLLYMYEEQLYYNEQSHQLKNLSSELKRIRKI